MIKKIFVLASFLCVSLFAIDDTFENRNKESDKYIEIMSMKTTLIEAFQKGAYSKSKTKKERDEIDALAKKYINMDEIISELKDVLVKNYTADELAAMNNFYSSPEGKSIVKKQAAVSAEMSKKMQTIIFKVLMNILNDKSLQKEKAAPKSDASPTAI